MDNKFKIGTRVKVIKADNEDWIGEICEIVEHRSDHYNNRLLPLNYHKINYKSWFNDDDVVACSIKCPKYLKQ